MARSAPHQLITREEIVSINHLLQNKKASGFLNPSALDNLPHELTRVIFGHQLHPTLSHKCYVIIQSIATSHAFLDGNKRTAAVACNQFLIKNHHSPIEDGQLHKIIDAFVPHSHETMINVRLLREALIQATGEDFTPVNSNYPSRVMSREGSTGTGAGALAPGSHPLPPAHPSREEAIRRAQEKIAAIVSTDHDTSTPLFTPATTPEYARTPGSKVEARLLHFPHHTPKAPESPLPHYSPPSPTSLIGMGSLIENGAQHNMEDM